jgi:hypothetical protein
MDKSNIDIWVYAHWVRMSDPKCIGIFSAHFGKGRKSFSFEYDKDWISSHEQMLLDPDLGWYSGQQYPYNKENFGVFLDSIPDSWGRTLMQRREPQRAKEEGWRLSPAFDVNPSIDKQGLALNIDTDNNALDYELARSVGEFFMLDIPSMDKIVTEVKSVVSDWRKYANSIGIPKTDQERMTPAFRF